MGHVMRPHLSGTVCHP